MKVVVEANWDEEARVWVAEAVDDIGLVTEAATIEELQRKLAIMVPDLLGEEVDGPFDIELIARSRQSVAAV
ncbi:MAG: DUF1902 domain-containing protein [Salaquimonas sp.]|jgi:hypothetical protein|nr:DUF1902 domain-containing protein [Salaquimonas sp.]